MTRRSGTLVRLAAIAAAALFGSCGDDGPTSSSGSGDLEVGIRASATSGRTPLVVTFSADVSGGRAPYAYVWDFGDGTRGSTPETTVTFTTAGTFPVTLRVTSSDGKTGTSAPVAVRADSDIRLHCTADPGEGIAPHSVHLAVDAIGGQQPYGFAWQFGDGGSSSQQRVNHTYSTPGVYNARVTVAGGASQNACTVPVTIHGEFRVSCRAFVESGTRVQFVASPSYCLFDACSWSWDFGGPGVAGGNPARPFRPEFTYDAPGTYVATVTGRTGDRKDACRVTVEVP